MNSIIARFASFIPRLPGLRPGWRVHVCQHVAVAVEHGVQGQEVVLALVRSVHLGDEVVLLRKFCGCIFFWELEEKDITSIFFSILSLVATEKKGRWGVF